MSTGGGGPAGGRPWTLAEAEEHLLGRELFGMRFGLERMRRLLTALGSPQGAYRAIHVVGTNGKSSTARYAAALLEASGVRTGTFLSPHLVSYAERVRVGLDDLAPSAFAAAVQRAARAAAVVERHEDEPVTQFELLTAAALHAFAEAEVRVAVVEAGLGGRYDATNVLDAEVVALTNVGLDHTRFLGPTVADIAREKLAVAGPRAQVVAGTPLDPTVEVQLPAAARRVDADSAAAVPGVAGYQRLNLALAAAAAEALLGAALAPELVARVGAQVATPGRLQRVAEAPPTWLDGAHNPAGAQALVAALGELTGPRPVGLVLAVLEDKDATGILRAVLPVVDRLVCTSTRNPRALPPATLASLAAQLGLPTAAAEVVPDPHDAVRRARQLVGPEGAVVATGSISLVADLSVPATGPARRASAF